MTSVALIGAAGFVGRRLGLKLRECGLQVTPVTRANYADMRPRVYDIVINSAMPAARFFAKQHPDRDFVETVQKTADLVHGWNAGKFVQVSSVSARCQLDTIYGRHKAAAEALIERDGNLIIRLGSMYDATLTKGVLIDMLLGRQVWVADMSRYCFSSLDFVTEWIAQNLDRCGVVEVGARNAISLRAVADHLGSSSEFAEYVDHQDLEDPDPTFPDAAEVLRFLDDAGPALVDQ